ncbi:hypothetical protein [Amycolatopsis regifaucium]|uniref:Uncharacterized protein n=1 Tax=Amycolatopsis regifaucium TaxID=546365 RepID=A0A154M730_9PSEU|nr:hypothetical protein [Amycolatopsis regifaucium]KZB79659.1 hypothetical protein AVL48_14710 [Amycolatopsis regifaucium]OKA10026.1 hypothetical protein ATP06_0206710 [Amycolatopsis regifaucium]SFI64562.1 hypothetical protein SAMN04489731_11246 [Amycolatopsis regifaucium]
MSIPVPRPLPEGSVDPSLAPLAGFSPEQLERFLEAVRTSSDGVQGTLESLTMTIMTSIE